MSEDIFTLICNDLDVVTTNIEEQKHGICEEDMLLLVNVNIKM